ncbi:MAG: ABC transporter ATP-binding protein [Bacteroidales bacterium]|jgi:iron complex transport system ATP-binding protein|nr:ABC transporter ATP-binding protein [Bacteroidales bacterium]
MISCDKFSFSYGTKEVLRDVNFTIPKGDFCALLGLNGSGKSTLLKLLAGLLSTQSGAIFIDQKQIKDYSIKNLSQKIAYVSQRQDIIFDFSVYDIVMMGRNPYQTHWSVPDAEDERIVADAIEMCHLSQLQEHTLTQISGGELQRTFIACAIAQQAPIILLDEPLSNLDIIHKFEIMEILTHLNQTQKTTILISLHDFSVAKQYAPTSMILSDGFLTSFGETSSILKPEVIKENFNLSDQFMIDDYGNVRKKCEVSKTFGEP